MFYNNSGSVIAGILICFLLAMYGWINNIAMLANSNFSAPYKVEVIRGIGIPIPLLGAVLGFIDMND